MHDALSHIYQIFWQPPDGMHLVMHMVGWLVVCTFAVSFVMTTIHASQPEKRMRNAVEYIRDHPSNGLRGLGGRDT